MPKKHQEQLPKIVHHKVNRHLKAAREKRESLFFGIGMFGTVGWTIAIPTLLATLLGRWLDSLHHGSISWTLTCLFIGMATGCIVAWRWINRQGEEK